MAAVPTILLATAGVIGAVAVTGHHLFHIFRGDHTQLHESLSRYYRVLIPFAAVSGVITTAFFSIMLFPRELSAITGGRALVDMAFLGLTLVWLGAARRIFAAVDELAAEYFAGDSGGS